MACTTSRCRPLRIERSRSASRLDKLFVSGSVDRTSRRSSIGNSPCRPRRRKLSITLWRAIALTHGVIARSSSQVCRFKWIANSVSCTTSSTSEFPIRHAQSCAALFAAKTALRPLTDDDRQFHRPRWPRASNQSTFARCRARATLPLRVFAAFRYRADRRSYALPPFTVVQKKLKARGVTNAT